MNRFGFQLCEGFERIPCNYIIEVKYDGESAIFDKGIFYNRRGNILTDRFPEIKVFNNCVVLGELCVFQEGISQFNKILERNTSNKFKIKLLSNNYPAIFVIFDVLEYENKSLINLPLSQRVGYLSKIQGRNIIVAEKLSGDIKECMANARRRGLEGIIIKDLELPYFPSRNYGYQKLKCFQEEIFDIISFEWNEHKTGFTCLVDVDGIPQRVGIGDSSIIEGIVNGNILSLKVQFLEKTDNGKLRIPSCREGIKSEVKN